MHFSIDMAVLFQAEECVHIAFGTAMQLEVHCKFRILAR